MRVKTKRPLVLFSVITPCFVSAAGVFFTIFMQVVNYFRRKGFLVFNPDADSNRLRPAQIYDPSIAIRYPRLKLPCQVQDHPLPRTVMRPSSTPSQRLRAMAIYWQH